MTQDRKRRFALLFIAVAAAIVVAVSCRNSPTPPNLETTIAPSGEPETYTATIVRSIEDDQHHEISETRVARSGDMRREEWMEKGERWAVITGFDSGKGFYLNLNRQTYIETDLAGIGVEKSKSAAQDSIEVEKQSSDRRQQAFAMDFAEDRFAEQPASLEERALPPVYIANQLCKVMEKRASFTDGRTEVTKIFLAENLSRLAIRTESESVSSTRRVKVVTEWRDIKLEASPGDFVVPANFKKVQR